jgi:hypothetical protein
MQVPVEYAIVPRIALEVMNEQLTAGSSNNSWLQMLQAASSTQIASLWRVLFVFLAWAVAAERRQAADMADARSPAARKAAEKAMAAVPYCHEQLLAAVGAPAEHEVGAHAACATNTLKQLWLMVIQPKLMASINTANSSSSSSSTAAAAAAPPQLLTQLVAAAPYSRALLLLLEAMLLQLYSSLYSHRVSSASFDTIGTTFELMLCMHQCLWQHHGAAAIAEELALWRTMSELLQQAVLHAAAAAGCKGFRPTADGVINQKLQELQAVYARLAMLCQTLAGSSE